MAVRNRASAAPARALHHNKQSSRHLSSTIRKIHIFTVIPYPDGRETITGLLRQYLLDDCVLQLLCTARVRCFHPKSHVVLRLDCSCRSTFPRLRVSKQNRTFFVYVCAAASSQNASRDHDQLRAGHRGEPKTTSKQCDNRAGSDTIALLVYTRSTLPRIIYSYTRCKHTVSLPQAEPVAVKAVVESPSRSHCGWDQGASTSLL